MESFGGLFEEEQVSALGNLASPDSYVQFFAAHSSERNEKSMSSLTGPDDSLPRTTIVLGAVPSTIDDIPEPPKAPIPTGEQSVVSQLGHFGAVSESGLYIDTKWIGDKSVNTVHTKIDLPYSTIKWKFDTGSKSRTRVRKYFVK